MSADTASPSFELIADNATKKFGNKDKALKALQQFLAKGTRFGQTTLLLTFAFKTLRTSTGWVAAFMANKVQQERYINAVYLKREAPPSLQGMLVVFLLFHIMLAVIAFVAILGLTLVLTGTHTQLRSRMLLAVFDFGIEIVLTSFLGLVIADVLSKKKYFAYRFEGLRAIRAYRELLFALTAVHGLMPYFLAAPEAWKA